MTLNSLFKMDHIACLMSDRLAVTRYTRYVARKSSYICPELVIAASGDEISAQKVIQRVFDRFNIEKVTRKGLLTDTLANMRDIEKAYPCVLIGWFIEGRKLPASFRWDSLRPASPRVGQAQWVEGLGQSLHDYVVPPYTEYSPGGPIETAATFCVERAATLWINEVVYSGMSRAHCGAGFDIYIYDTRSTPPQFRFLDEIGYLHFQLSYQMSNGVLMTHWQASSDYMKDTYDAVLTTVRADDHRISTFAIGSPQQGRERAGTVSMPISPMARMYACCFVIQDMKSRREYVEVLIATGVDAEAFSINLAQDAMGCWNGLHMCLPMPIISKMAVVATSRAQKRGVQLV